MPIHSDSQPITEHLSAQTTQYPESSRESRKPIAIQMQAVALSARGWNKSKIARELGIGVNTVKAILRTAKLDDIYTAPAKFGVNSFILDSVDTLGHHVGKKSLKAAMYVLDNTIFADSASNGTKMAVQVNVNIPRASVDPPAIDAKTVPELPNTGAQST